jgi:hypothetical protein
VQPGLQARTFCCCSRQLRLLLLQLMRLLI